MTAKESLTIMYEWPRMTKSDIEKADALFRNYLFYDTKGNIIASCCGQHGTVETQALGQHREKGYCPFCGRPARWYAKRFKKKNLTQYVPAMFLHVRDKTVYAQTFWMLREYTQNLTPKTQFSLTYSYRFRPGAANMWENWSCFNEKDEASHIDDWFKRDISPLKDETGNAPYYVIGLERLKGTHLEYLGAGDCGYKTGMYLNLTKRFMLASYYPIEMLEKHGLKCFVASLMHGVKNQEIIDFTQADPRKALGLNGAELKQLAPYTHKIELLRLRKRLLKRGYQVSIADCADLLLLCENHYCKLVQIVDKIGVSPIKLRRYLAGQVNQCGRACMGGFDTRLTAWRYYVDYLTFCTDLKQNLRDRLVAFPRDLAVTHDDMARRAAELATEIRLAKDEALMKKRAKALKALIKKYSFSYGDYIIRFPLTMAEIQEEGNTLRHCVGGYARRHIEGKTTILFLRRAEKPDTPLATIEMNGNMLVQVHGYRNELERCMDNPNRIPARKLYGEILNIWLDWLNAKSPRDKNGIPIIKKVEAETA